MARGDAELTSLGYGRAARSTSPDLGSSGEKCGGHVMKSIPSWLPNAISVTRLALVPVWIAIAEDVRAHRLDSHSATTLILPGLLLVLGLSDILDGFLARKYGLTSRLGERLDAAADKLAQAAFVGYLAVRGPPVWTSIPVEFAILVIGRDVVLAAGFVALRACARSVDTTHRLHGKVSSVVLFFVVLAAVADMPGVVVRYLVGAATVAIVVSSVGYIIQGARGSPSSRAPNVGVPQS